MKYVITSAVTMLKSHEKKISKLFSYDGVVNCRRNLNFEKMRLPQEKVMGFDYCEEYLRSTLNKILLWQCYEKQKNHSAVILGSIKK